MTHDFKAALDYLQKNGMDEPTAVQDATRAALEMAIKAKEDKGPLIRFDPDGVKFVINSIIIHDKVYENKLIYVSDKTFFNCHFLSCKLVSGKIRASYFGCQMERCEAK